MITKLLRRSVKELARRQGFEIVQTSLLYDWQMARQPGRSYTTRPLPSGAAEYLRSDNRRLNELRERYSRFDAPVTKALIWTDQYLVPEDLTYFRGDNPYIFQLRGRNMNELSYTLTYYAVKAADGLRLLERLEEDGAFGVHTFEVDNRLISRDLLDSVVELNFLERHLQISRQPQLRVVDIGAGYGRLAHRAVSGLPSIASYLCTDAVPASSFICEYYLRHRRLEDRARVVPLDEIESALSASPIDVALNIHSFSECRLEAIDWWVALLKRHRVRRLMIVPNVVAADNATMLTNARENFSQVVLAHGYRLIANEPKYLDPMIQKYGINPVRHFLFGLD